MVAGNIIVFETGDQSLIYAQVSQIGLRTLTAKKLFSDELLVLPDWHKSHLDQTLSIADFSGKKDRFERFKTVVYRRYRSWRRPSRLQKWLAWLSGGDYVKVMVSESVPAWHLRRKVHGTLYADGFFLPYPGQPITHAIYFEHLNLLQQWKTRLALLSGNPT